MCIAPHEGFQAVGNGVWDERRDGVQLTISEENLMRAMFKAAITAVLAIVLPGLVFISEASAQCASLEGLKAAAMQLQSWQGPGQFERASFLRVAGQQGSDDRIVGFWKVKFISEGNTGIGIPDGAVIDNGFVQWHGDGTEIMNSSRPPATSNFCLGVWQKSGPSSYELNHFALSSDLSGNFVGPAQIREDITLSQDAEQYAGTFTIDQYDAAGNPLVHIAGKVTATRINVDTTVGQVL